MKNNNTLHKLKNEYIGRSFATVCGYFIVVLTLTIILFVASK